MNLRNQPEPATGVAYFYFDFNDSEQQRTENLIRSLIVQLSAQFPHIPEPLHSAYSGSQNGHNQPTVEELTCVLSHIVKRLDSTYIILDALGECEDQEDLFDFIEALVGWDDRNLHLLTTSRKDHDIASSLEPFITCELCMQSALVDADIHVHVLDKLSTDPKLKK